MSSAVNPGDTEGAVSRRVCSRCGFKYAGEPSPCPHDESVATTKLENWMTGSILAEQFEIISLIGRGGMSAVYKARQLTMERLVAIKVLHLHLVSHSVTMKRFQQEAKAVSKLTHPHIVAVHDFGTLPERQPYLVMEYLEGDTLAAVLEREKLLGFERALPIFRQICQGLEHAHQRGIIHRDVKPSNVILLQSEVVPDFVKIVDFGIAKLLPLSGIEGQKLTRTGEVFGSPQYMSPEQARGHSPDARSDIYSLGCIMYEVLTGEPPFLAQSLLETMYMRLTDDPAPISDKRPDLGVPYAVEDVVLKALSREPDQRQQSMAELAGQIEKTRAELERPSIIRSPIHKGSAGLRRLFRQGKRFWLKLSVALAALTLFLAGTLLWVEFTGGRMGGDAERSRHEVLWSRYDQDGQKLLDQGNYGEAERALKAAVAEAERFGEQDRRLSVSLNKLVTVYQLAGKRAAVDQVRQRLASIRQLAQTAAGDADSNLDEVADLTLRLVPKKLQKSDQAHSEQLAEKLNQLAALCINTQDYDKAEQLLSKALEIEAKTVGPNSEQAARTMTALAHLLHINEGKYEQAKPLYEQALAIREKASGGQDPEVANALRMLAHLYQDMGQYARAEDFYRRALAIDEQTLGQDHPTTATVLTALGGLYQLEGKYDHAESLYRRALAVYEQVFGPDDIKVGMSLNNLAGLSFGSGKYAEAIPLYKRALAIYEQRRGADDPSVAKILNNLAVVSYQQGHYDKAEPLFKRALAIRERSLPPEHPELAQSLNGLAQIYSAEGKYQQAEPMLERALAINEKAFGPDHREVALVLNSLGQVYEDEGRYGKAEGLYQRALEIRESSLGPDHPDVARSLNYLADVYVKEGKLGPAEELLTRALAIREQAFGRNSPAVATTLDSYSSLLWRTNRISQSIQLKAKAMTIRLAQFFPF